MTEGVGDWPVMMGNGEVLDVECQVVAAGTAARSDGRARVANSGYLRSTHADQL